MNKKGFFRSILLMGCLAVAMALMGGCATVPEKPSIPPVTPSPIPPPEKVPPVWSRTFPDFIAVIVQEGDTLSSLSLKYLNDPSLDWFIAEYNEISDIRPGQALVIPLKPFEKGGLNEKRYQTVPVLVYHNFSISGKNRSTVTQADFEEQMKFLRDNGYHVITMDQLFDFLDFKIQIPKKSVLITIDDGWRSLYDIAFPILKKYGYPATLFVYTDLITGSSKTLSWELVQTLAENGIDLQCHSKTHRKLTTMDPKESFKEYFDAIEKEIVDCPQILKRRFRREVRYFAYPFGDTNPLIIELLKKQGYRGAFTVKRGGNPFFIHNYRVNRSMIYGELNLKQFETNLAAFADEGLK